MTLRPGLASHRVISRIHALLGLAVLAVILGYFVVPPNIVERGSAQRARAHREMEIQSTVADLTQLTLVIHLNASRADGGPSAASSRSMGFLDEIAPGAREGIGARLLRLGQLAGGGSVAAPLIGRLDQKVRAFLEASDSTERIEAVLLAAEQLQRSSARSLELSEQHLGQVPGTARWQVILLLCLLVGVGGAGVLTLRSTKANLNALDRTLQERDQRAMELERERDFSQRLVEAAPAIILVLDTQGRIVHVNRFFEELTDFRIEEVRGRDWVEAFIPPDDRARIRSRFQEVTEGGDLRKQVNAILTRSGQERSVEWSNVRILDASGATMSVLSIGTDVTERQRLEEALRDREERLRLALQASGQGSYDLDLVAGRFKVSREYATMLGYDPAGFFETRSALEARLHSEDRGRFQSVFDACLRGERPTLEVEFRQRTRSGDWVWTRSVGSVVSHDASGRPLRMLGTHTNIDQHKRAEEALRTSEARYRRAERGTNDGLWEWNIVTGEEYRSPRWLAILGYADGDLPDTVDGFLHLIHPDDWALYATARERHLRDEEPYDVDLRLRRKDGSYIWVQSRGDAERDENGTAVRMAGFITDISDRRRAHQIVEASRKQLERVLDTMYVFVGVFSLEGIVEDMNRAALEGGGLQRADALGRRLLDLPFFAALPGTTAQVQDCLDRAARGEVVRIDLAVRLGKEIRYFDSIFSPLFAEDGTIRKTIASGVDITERRKATADLQASEARLNDAQRTARVGSWDLDIATSRLHWSDQIFEIFEVDAKTFESSYDAFLALVHPDDRASVDAAYSRSLRDREPYRITHRLRMSDGRIKYVEEQCITDFTPDGTPLRSRGTVQDVTERVVGEQAIHRSLAEKETLLREIHHRVKNNLQIVSSLLYFQAKKATRDEASVALFAEARQQLHSMILVHDKLYNSGNLAEVDFAEYLRSLVQDVSAAGDPGGRIRFLVEAQELRAPIEIAMPCGMIVVELMTNVLKYAYPGGRTGETRISLDGVGGQTRLTVADDGIGWPSDFDAANTDSFGWQLIRNLTDQLGGSWAIGRGAGASASIVFTVPRADSIVLPEDA